MAPAHLDIDHAHHATAVVHVLLEIHFSVLEDERERPRRVDDVVQGDDVGVLQVLQKRDLSNGRARGSFFMLQANLLQCYQLVCDSTHK